MRSISIDEAKLIQEILAGETERYSILIREYQDWIYRYCLSFLRHEEDARDAAQESFIKAFKVLSQFQGRSSFYTWLYQIATSHCLDLVRKRKRSKTDSIEVILETQPFRLETWTFDDSSLDQQEKRQQIDELLSILDPDEKAALLLREQEQLSYQEMAQTLGISLDGVKAKLYRIRQKIRQQIRHFSEKEIV